MQTLRSWKRWTHRKSSLKDSMQRNEYLPKKMENLFSSRRWTNQTSCKRSGTENIHLRPIRGESHVDFLGESEGSDPPPHDSFPDAGEAINDFWSISGNFIYRHHVEPRVKLYSPREESFPIPLKYIDVSRLHIRIWMSSKSDASMIIGMSMGQEICLVHGRVSLNLLY